MEGPLCISSLNGGGLFCESPRAAKRNQIVGPVETGRCKSDKLMAGFHQPYVLLIESYPIWRQAFNSLPLAGESEVYTVRLAVTPVSAEGSQIPPRKGRE